MGKKRRIIHRSTKFMTKYFQFLDNIDGANDSSLDSKFLNTRFKSLEVTDNGNQTFKFTGVLQGPGDGTGNKLTGDIVKFSVDGNATQLHAKNDDLGNIFIAASGQGRGKYVAGPKEKDATERKGMIINDQSDTVLSPGKHTLVCTLAKEDGTLTDVSITKKFDIARSIISFSPAEDFLSVQGGDTVKVDLSKIGVVTGSERPGEVADYDPHSTNGVNGGGSFLITVTEQVGREDVGNNLTAQQVAEAANPVDLAANAIAATANSNEGHGVQSIDDLLSGVADSKVQAGEYAIIKVTLTARDASNTALPDSVTAQIAVDRSGE